MKRIIGISGVASSGKDTFVELLEKNLPNVKRFALADNLKKEVWQFIHSSYGVDIFTCSREIKDLLRPILVTHGKFKRISSQGRFWTEALQGDIKNYLNLNPSNIAVISDIRYNLYPKDEVYWLKNEMDGVLVHISRWYDDEEEGDLGGRFFTVKHYVEPPNQDEKENDPKLISGADYKISWPTLKNNEGKPDLDSLNSYAKDFIKFLYKEK